MNVRPAIRTCRSTLAALALSAILTLLPAASVGQPGLAIAIRGVTLIDGNGGPPRPNTTVLIVGDRIVGIGPVDTTPIPTGATVIDGRGKFLTPGLIDMHAHVTLGPVRMEIVEGVPSMRVEVDSRVPEMSLRTLLAYGVTSIRDPGGDTEALVALRDAVASGTRVGPRMRVAGAVIDRTAFAGLTARFTDEASLRTEIRNQAATGVDMVKLYITLTPEEIAAAVDEAHRLGVETVAHTLATTWTDAARAGLDGIVHILPGSPDLLPADRRAQYVSEMAGTQFMFTWFEHVDLDSVEIREMVAALVEHRVTVDPTLVMWDTMVRGDDAAVIASPDLAMAAPSMVGNWQTTFNMNPGWQPSDFERGRAAFVRALELTRLLHEAGVVLTAGTDANNPWVVPGPSLHRELELLAAAGIPPLEVLGIATRNGAAVLGLLDELGTVEVGKVADLLLLDADPSRDITATRAIVDVFQGGRRLDREQLLAEAAAIGKS